MIMEQLQQSRAYQYYEALAPNDRRMLNILAIFLSIVILIFFILIPSFNYSADAQQRYKKNLETLEWMRANQGRIGSSNKGSLPSNQSLLGVVTTSSRQFNLAFARYEPAGDNGLNLWVDAANFNSLILWLEKLDKEFGISIEEISVESNRNNGSGIVDARLVLRS